MKVACHAFAQFFEEAAVKWGVDWRLLAAIGYQESHWRSGAVSPTGVRGIMMLTEDTADYLGLEDRLDPRTSILGGAQYYARQTERVADSVDEPDRTWMALAAYNVGFNHIKDARQIVEWQGGNPRYLVSTSVEPCHCWRSASGIAGSRSVMRVAGSPSCTLITFAATTISCSGLRKMKKPICAEFEPPAEIERPAIEKPIEAETERT